MKPRAGPRPGPPITQTSDRLEDKDQITQTSDRIEDKDQITQASGKRPRAGSDWPIDEPDPAGADPGPPSC